MYHWFNGPPLAVIFSCDPKLGGWVPILMPAGNLVFFDTGRAHRVSRAQTDARYRTDANKHKN